VGDPSILRWRTGRKVGRTIYAQPGAYAADEDILIGVMDTPKLARETVMAHNRERTVRLAAGEAGPLPDGAYEVADEAFEGRGVTNLDGRDELEAGLLAAAPLIRAVERERIITLAESVNATVFTDLTGDGAPFADLIRKEATDG
jgi:hypothetical protein